MIRLAVLAMFVTLAVWLLAASALDFYGRTRKAQGHWDAIVVAGELALIPFGTDPRAISSAGRAPPRQGGGHWFEPSIAHPGRADPYHWAWNERLRARYCASKSGE